MILVIFSLFGNILCSNLTLFLGADNEINIQAEKAIFPYCSLAGVSSFVGIFGATTNFDITSLYIFIFIVGVLQLGFLIYILCSLLNLAHNIALIFSGWITVFYFVVGLSLSPIKQRPMLISFYLTLDSYLI